MQYCGIFSGLVQGGIAKTVPVSGGKEFLLRFSTLTSQTMWLQEKQDPVSTMQKTGWTIHSPFLVLFGLKKNFTLDVITRGQATTIFLCIGPFSAWSRTTEQPGDPRASLLLTSVRRQSFAMINEYI